MGIFYFHSYISEILQGGISIVPADWLYESANSTTPSIVNNWDRIYLF